MAGGKLFDLLMGRKPKPEHLGDGLASKAAESLYSRAYQLYVQEAQANGEEPMSFEEYERSKRAKG